VAVRGNQTVAIAAVPPRPTTLRPGWNLVTYTGAPDTPVGLLFGGTEAVVDAIHRWDPVRRRFESAFPFAPSHTTLALVQPLEALWVHVRGSSSVEWARYGGPLPATAHALQPGWNLVPWVGERTAFTTAALPLFGVAAAVYRWDPQSGAFQTFSAVGPSFVNSLTTLEALDGLWVYVVAGRDTPWSKPGVAAVVP